MRSIAILLGAAAVVLARPQDCAVVTTQVMRPTLTQTYISTPVLTVYPTSAQDLGTFTKIATLEHTRDILTMTERVSACDGTIHGVARSPLPITTVYTHASLASLPTSSSQAARILSRDLGIDAREDVGCTVTVTTTSLYGQTQVWTHAGVTSTYSLFTDFHQATVTSTRSDWTVFAVATASTTLTAACLAASAAAGATVTVTQDARCAPSALVSAYHGYGLDHQNDTPNSGAAWATITDDGSECCQLCAEQEGCAASSWDIRTKQCKLEFPVDFETGEMNCGEGLLAYYDAGPVKPMLPGTGLYVAELCGHAVFVNAQPDDGT